LAVRCAGIKRDGGRCTTIVKPPQTHCYQHDPERAEERKRNASRAGKSGSKEVRDLKRRISDVIDAVLDGSQDRGRAAVAIQGFNALKGVLELERKIKETDALEARIEALEQSQVGGSRRWGA
jgi:uncharacterized protein YwlG (UPF0340 family)